MFSRRQVAGALACALFVVMGLGSLAMASSVASAAISSPTTVVELPSTGMTTNVQWAELVLQDGGWPVSTNNVTVMTQWMGSENYVTTWWAPTFTTAQPALSRNNPLNSGYGASAFGGLGAYPTLTTAAYYVARQLHYPTYGYKTIAADLTKSAPVGTTAKAIQDSTWATSHYGHGTSWYGDTYAGKHDTPTVRPPTYAATSSFWDTGDPNTIYGATADATAAAELEHAYPPVGTTCPGPKTGDRPVILARDTTYPDALASQYLAGDLGTGTLLTPTATLSAATLAALRDEGISQVYVVGGYLAVSTTVVDELERTPVYECGGTTPYDGGTSDITVRRIAGTTEYTTAADIAEGEPLSPTASVDLSSAYAGVNSTGGAGKYNTTAGAASTAPKTTAALPTAILATGAGFQDAMAASAFAYKTHLPVLLTTPASLSPQASNALSDLGIKQVIVMGGPDAVSDTVVKALMTQGISVLRVAGVDNTQTAVEAALLEHGAKSSTEHLGLGWTGHTSAVSRGTFFSDGIAGAVLEHGPPTVTAAKYDGVSMLQTESPSTVGPYLTTLLETRATHGITIASLEVLGGPDAVQTATISAMEAAVAR